MPYAVSLTMGKLFLQNSQLISQFFEFLRFSYSPILLIISLLLLKEKSIKKIKKIKITNIKGTTKIISEFVGRKSFQEIFKRRSSSLYTSLLLAILDMVHLS